jgi:4-amino-4-deoxy-L-arabinose transferase-like glycosyltransferase
MNGNRGQIAGLACCAALLVVFATTARLAWSDKSITYDEPLHLVSAWAQVHDSDFQVDAENSALWKYYVAAGTDRDDLPLELSTPRIPYGPFCYQALFGQSQVDVAALTDSARTRMTLLAVVLGGIVAWWAWRLAGRIAAIVATAAFCFDPNFLAHSPLIKNDVPIAMSFLAFMAIVWLLGERVTIWRFAMTGLLLGAALTIKFSGVLTVPALGVALTFRALLPQPWDAFKWTVHSRVFRLALAASVTVGSLGLAMGVVWAVYGFRFAPTSESDNKIDFASLMRDCAIAESRAEYNAPSEARPEVLENWAREWNPSLIPRFAGWMNRYHVLPQPWVEGFLIIHSTGQMRSAFLCGEERWTGWWYYFPLAMAFKTPLATIAAIVLAAVTAMWWQSGEGEKQKKGWVAIGLVVAGAVVISLALRPLFQSGSREYLPVYSSVILGLFLIAILGVAGWAVTTRIPDLWPLIAAGVCPVLYMAFAMSSHLDIGIRHILPVYPFLFILIGVAAGRSRIIWPRLSVAIICLFVLGLAAESYAAFPNYIPFFNVAVGGSRGGLNLLGEGAA